MSARMDRSKYRYCRQLNYCHNTAGWTVNLPSYVRMSVARNSLCKNNETPNLTDLRATVLSTRIF